MVVTELTRGMRDRLGKYTRTDGELEIVSEISGPGAYDTCCFGVDQVGLMFSMYVDQAGRMVKGVRQSVPGTNVTAVRYVSSNADGVRFGFVPDDVPPEMVRLVFAVRVNGSGVMGEISAHTLRVRQTGEEILRLRLLGTDFAKETAVVSMEFYRLRGEWRFSAVGRGFNGGMEELTRSYGGVDLFPVRTPGANQTPGPSIPTPGANQTPGPSVPTPEANQTPGASIPTPGPSDHPVPIRFVREVTPLTIPRNLADVPILPDSNHKSPSDDKRISPSDGNHTSPSDDKRISPQDGKRKSRTRKNPSVPVLLSNGQRVSLDKTGGNPVTVENGWTAPDKDYDLKALVRYRDGRLIYVGAANVDEVLSTPEGAVRHDGDVKRPGEPERVSIRWHPDIASVAVSSYSARENGRGSFHRNGVFVRIVNGEQVFEIPAANTSANDRSYTLCFGEIVFGTRRDELTVLAMELYSRPNSELRIGYKNGRVVMDAGPIGKFKK